VVRGVSSWVMLIEGPETATWEFRFHVELTSHPGDWQFSFTVGVNYGFQHAVPARRTHAPVSSENPPEATVLCRNELSRVDFAAGGPRIAAILTLCDNVGCRSAEYITTLERRVRRWRYITCRILNLGTGFS
jgi:hypothetical protein